MIKRLFVSFVIALLLCSSGWAILGIGDVVYDPAVEFQMIAQIAKDVVMIGILGDQLKVANDISAQQVINATPIPQKSLNWSFPIPQPNFPVSTDTYGTSGSWIQALNGVLAPLIGYQSATIQPQDASRIYASMSPFGIQNFAANYATLELNDGVAQNAMGVTGGARGLATQASQVLAKLVVDSLSDDPFQNTEVGVLNKINAATMTHAQTLQGTNQILSAMADQQTVELKVRHDVMVQELNTAIAAPGAAVSANTALFDGSQAAHAARF